MLKIITLHFSQDTIARLNQMLVQSLIDRDYRFDPLTRDGKSTVSSADLSTLQVIAPRRAERVQPVGLCQWGALLHLYIGTTS